MALIELIYDPECPNLPLAREHLRLALQRLGARPEWVEHAIGDPALPAHARGYGSPSVLIDGRDVAGLPPSGEPCCRVYPGPEGLGRAPSVELLVAALSSKSWTR